MCCHEYNRPHIFFLLHWIDVVVCLCLLWKSVCNYDKIYFAFSSCCFSFIFFPISWNLYFSFFWILCFSISWNLCFWSFSISWNLSFRFPCVSDECCLELSNFGCQSNAIGFFKLINIYIKLWFIWTSLFKNTNQKCESCHCQRRFCCCIRSMLHIHMWPHIYIYIICGLYIIYI